MNNPQLRPYKAWDLPVRIFHWVNFTAVIGLIIFGLLMLFKMVVMAITGLIRAGTDIYYPPFGSLVAGYVAAPGTDPASLVPYDPTGMEPSRAEALKTFKDPFGIIHLYTAYMLMFLIVIHIFAVVFVEVREGGGLISAMFSGNKVLSGKPVDGES